VADEEQFVPQFDDATMSVEAWEDEPEGEGWFDAERDSVVDDLRPGETLEERNARLCSGTPMIARRTGAKAPSTTPCRIASWSSSSVPNRSSADQP
jgi:hypothetical protein